MDDAAYPYSGTPLHAWPWGQTRAGRIFPLIFNFPGRPILLTIAVSGLTKPTIIDYNNIQSVWGERLLTKKKFKTKLSRISLCHWIPDKMNFSEYKLEQNK